MKKQIVYLFQRTGADTEYALLKKEELKEEGYLVVTIKEGAGCGASGMKEIIRNHIS